MSAANHLDQYVGERELEQRLGMAPRTLAKRRQRRQDTPPPTKIGRSVRYNLAAVQAWLAAHTAESGSSA
jgi:predicted DNA-binding transcriptional regulator AlpA